MPCSFLPWILDFSGIIYLIIVSVSGMEFMRRSLMLFKEVKGSEKSLFLYSIFYLTIVFAGICLDKFILNYY